MSAPARLADEFVLSPERSPFDDGVSVHRRTPPESATQKIAAGRSERAPGGGRRRAGSAMYAVVHEESEHRRTPPGARAVALQRFSRVPRASGPTPLPAHASLDR